MMRRPLFFKFLLCTLSVALLSGLQYCIFAGYADAISLRSRSLLAEVRKTNDRVDRPFLLSATQDIKDASFLVPDSPVYFEELAWLSVLIAGNAGSSSVDASLNFRLARESYLRAVFLRPMSATTWANLCLSLFYVSTDDNNINDCVQVALNYGLHDPQTLRPLFTLSMRRWSKVPSPQKQTLLLSLGSAKRDLKNDLVSIIQNVNKD